MRPEITPNSESPISDLAPTSTPPSPASPPPTARSSPCVSSKAKPSSKSATPWASPKMPPTNASPAPLARLRHLLVRQHRPHTPDDLSLATLTISLAALPLATPPSTLAATLTTTIATTSLATASTTSSASLLIAKGVSHLMLTAKLAKIGLITALILLTTTAAGITVQHLLSQIPPAPVTAHTVAVAALSPVAPATTSPMPAETIPCPGIVVDEQGKPFAGALVTLYTFSATSGPDGRFTLTLPRDTSLTAYYFAASPDRSSLAFTYIDPFKNQSPASLRLVLRPARLFTVNVADAQGAPVADATVAADLFTDCLGHAATDTKGVAVLRIPADAQILQIIAAKPSLGLDYVLFGEKGYEPPPGRLDGNFTGPVNLVLDGAKSLTIHVVDGRQQPIPGAVIGLDNLFKPGKELNAQLIDWSRVFTLTTDAQGNATCAFIPSNVQRKFSVQILKEGYVENAIGYDPATNQNTLTTTLLSKIRFTGRVLDSSGQPVSGANVRIRGRGRTPGPTKYVQGPIFVTTSAGGTFAFDGDPNLYYTISAQKDHAVSPHRARPIPLDAQPDPIELKLQPAIRIHGQITAGPDHAPLANYAVGLTMKEESYRDLPPDQQILTGDDSLFNTPILLERGFTNKDGFFEFYAQPGSYILAPSNTFLVNGASVGVVGSKFHIDKAEFDLANEPDHAINLHADQPPPHSGNPASKMIRAKQETPSNSVSPPRGPGPCKKSAFF